VYQNPLFSEENKKTYGSKGWVSEGYTGDDLNFTVEEENFFEK
jgi:hypothetical protein